MANYLEAKAVCSGSTRQHGTPSDVSLAEQCILVSLALQKCGNGPDFASLSGIMVTSGIIHNVLHYFNLPVHIRDVCVMLAPAFSGLTA